MKRRTLDEMLTTAGEISKTHLTANPDVAQMVEDVRTLVQRVLDLKADLRDAHREQMTSSTHRDEALDEHYGRGAPNRGEGGWGG